MLPLGAHTAQATTICWLKPRSTPARRKVAWYGWVGPPPDGLNAQSKFVTEPTMKLVVEPRHSSMPTSTRDCAMAEEAEATRAVARAIVVRRIMWAPPQRQREATASQPNREV